jgi:hypothetical protein
VIDTEVGISAVAVIALVSLAMTILALLVIRRWSDQEGIARLRRLSQAHLLEFRLFREDPSQILRSQRALIADQLRLVAGLSRPLLILGAPMVLVMSQLDALYGRAPLRVGEAAVVSIDSREIEITAPEHFSVETRPFFAQASGQTSWRVRPSRATSGMVRIGSAQRRIVAGSGLAYLPGPIIADKGISITYSSATVYGCHWMAWFLGFSVVSAFGLRRRLRTVF